jgi:two-component system, LuxR family, sensor kinase FixL
LLIQTLNQNGILADISDFSVSEKPRVIRVLQVDDEDSVIEISKQILKDMDSSLELDSARCVDEAFKKLSTGQFDVVVSDYEMPQKNGLEFLEELREQSYQIPFILFTGKGREEVAAKALNMGAFRYLHKQGDPETVFTELSSSIRQAAELFRSVKAIKDSELKYRKIFEEAIDAMFLGDAETGIIIDCNPAASKLTGRKKEEMVGHPQSILHPQEPLQEGLTNIFRKHRINPNSVDETQIITGTGEIKDVAIKASFFYINGRKVMQGTFRDITDKKKMETAMRESEEKFHTISNSVSDALVLVDNQGRVDFWSPSAERIFGYKSGEAQGKAIHDLVVPKMSPKELEVVVSGLKNFGRKGRGDFLGKTIELIARKKDNTEFPIKLSLSPIFLNGKWNAVALARDITEQKAFRRKLEEYSEGLEYTVKARTKELEETQLRLLKSERLAAIGELAGMVGHDLRNPLQGIKVATAVLGKKGTATSEVQFKRMLEIIDREIVHSDKIINDLLDYSREIHLELQECSPIELLSTSLSMMQIPEKVKVLNEISDKPVFKVDLSKIVRVFRNLIKNAIDAMPDGGTIKICCKQIGKTIKFSFCDTGDGIAAEFLPKLFTPLCTSKAQGMGFGLAISKRLVEAHRGSITVETCRGKGTTFNVILPINPELADEA